MKTMRPRVLFLSHQAELYGASQSLLLLLRYLRAQSDWDIRVIVREVPGALSPALEAIAPVRYFGTAPATRQGIRRRRGARAAAQRLRDALVDECRRRRTIRWVRSWRPDLIYSNTAMNGDVIEAIGCREIPVVVHVRELDWYLSRLSPVQRSSLLRRPALYFAVSGAVRRYLVEQFSLPEQRIAVVPPSVDSAEILARSLERDPAAVRSDMGLGPEDVLIGAVGYADRRKGADLFLATALQLLRARAGHPRVFFTWIGGGPELPAMRKEAAEAGVADRFHFAGLQSNPYPYIRAMDMLFMCSRDDPFPRVNLEAGLLGKPIVTFAGSGGSAEFVGSECGLLVPDFEPATAAAALGRMIDDSSLRRQCGERAARKVRERYDTSVVGATVCSQVGTLWEQRARA